MHPSTWIEITKFIPIQGGIGMETEYSFSFLIPAYQTCQIVIGELKLNS